MAGMTVTHPMRRGTAQLFGGDRMIGLNGLSGLRKESSQHAPKVRAGDAGITVFPKTAHQGRFRIPPFPADWQLTLCQVLVQRRIRERRQGHLTVCHLCQPNAASGHRARRGGHYPDGADQFASAQARGIAEVEHEAQALCCRLGPAVGPFGPSAMARSSSHSPSVKPRAVSSAGRKA